MVVRSALVRCLGLASGFSALQKILSETAAALLLRLANLDVLDLKGFSGPFSEPKKFGAVQPSNWSDHRLDSCHLSRPFIQFYSAAKMCANRSSFKQFLRLGRRFQGTSEEVSR